VLDRTLFTELKGQRLRDQDFAVVKNDVAAGRSRALIVYNKRNGSLFYNADRNQAGLGLGGGALLNESMNSCICLSSNAPLNPPNWGTLKGWKSPNLGDLGGQFIPQFSNAGGGQFATLQGRPNLLVSDFGVQA
jgi:hypothetical protein